MTLSQITTSFFLLISLVLTSYANAQETPILEPDTLIHFEVEINITEEWLRLRVLTEEPVSLEGLELRPIGGSSFGIPAINFSVLSEGRLAQNEQCYVYRISPNAEFDRVGCSTSPFRETSRFWLDENNMPQILEVYWHDEHQRHCQDRCTVQLEQVLNIQTNDELPPSERVIAPENSETSLILDEVINSEEYLDFINELILDAGFTYFPEGTYDVEIDGVEEEIEVNAFIINRHSVEREDFNNHSDSEIKAQELARVAEISLARPTHSGAEEYCLKRYDFVGSIPSASELLVAFSLGNLSQDILELEGFGLMGFYEEWSSTENVDDDIQTVIVHDDYSLSTEIRPRTLPHGLIAFRCAYPVPNDFNLSGGAE